MTLTARYVRQPRQRRVCDWCWQVLAGHIYLYGAADSGDRPFAMRLHVGCCPNLDGDPKIAAALAAAESEAR